MPNSVNVHQVNAVKAFPVNVHDNEEITQYDGNG
jgi:hypothetical protein